MNRLLYPLAINLRLHFRNRLALLYSYLFPTIFLVAFWVLYRHERVPLARHMGELLTVTALGGACFGLPTALVNERERGVWRRYRLAPVPTASLIASTVIARYFLLLIAALLQLALALGIGMPLPRHPLDLWLAFTFVAFAFLGLGLVIAMMADNVPAVQALGQCIFLPMLIIGGVAVRLERLPVWAQHVSAFFPGRYAVDAIQAAVTGDGSGGAGFSLVALLVMGVAGGVAGAKMFRWDAQQRFATHGGHGWAGVALASWLAVGLLAESGGYVGITRPAGPATGTAAELATRTSALPAVTDTAADDAASTAVEPVTDTAADGSARAATEPAIDTAAGAAARTATEPAIDTAAGAAARTATEPAIDTAKAARAPQRTAPASTPPVKATEEAARSEAAPPAHAEPPPWQAVKIPPVESGLYERLPPDNGVVAPIASIDEAIYPELADHLECVRSTLPAWGPGQVDDPVQRVRNYLYVAAVPDMFQMEPLERWLPLVVLDRLKRDIPGEQLTRILYWIASHPSEGDDSAADQLRAVCIDAAGPSDLATLRERTTFYALKLLGRLTGARSSR
jgi:hypothetical protein